MADLHISSCTENNSLPVILFEISPDGLGVRRIDWRAKRLDHFGDFRIPARRIEKRRIHGNVIEAVTGAAMALDNV